MACNRDALSYILRVEPANQMRFERLRNVEALVCWEWRGLVKTLRVDRQWLKAFLVEAESYCTVLVPELQWSRDYKTLIQYGLWEYRSHTEAFAASIDALFRLLEGGYTLATLAVDAFKLVDCGVFEAIAETMRACCAAPVFDGEVRLAVACVQFLEYMFKEMDTDSKYRARRSQVCQAVACMVQRHSSVTRLQEHAFEILSLGKKRLGVARGAVAAIAALRFHMDDPQAIDSVALWHKGLDLLYEISVTRNGPTPITDIQREIMADGGLDVLLRVLRLPRPGPDVYTIKQSRFFLNQYRVLMVLGQLAGCLDAATTQAIVDADGIALIVAVMLSTPTGDEEHSNVRNMQAAGCFALDFIGWADTALQQRIIDAGGVPAVEAAMRIKVHRTKHNNRLLYKHGRRLLRRLR